MSRCSFVVLRKISFRKAVFFPLFSIFSHRLIRTFVLGFGLLMANAQSFAAMETFGFFKLTNNNAEDLSSQLSITVWDYTEANSEFGLSLASSQLLFTIENDVGITSNISEVYFDDGFLGPSSVLNSLGGFTNFSGGGASPGNLPGGNLATPPFVATTEFSADVNPGNPDNGVNMSSDILGIVLGLGSYADFNAVITAVNSGEIRFGYHIRTIGELAGSDSYVSTVVPIPAAAWLFISALLGLVGVKKRLS